MDQQSRFNTLLNRCASYRINKLVAAAEKETATTTTNF